MKFAMFGTTGRRRRHGAEIDQPCPWAETAPPMAGLVMSGCGAGVMCKRSPRSGSALSLALALFIGPKTTTTNGSAITSCVGGRLRRHTGRRLRCRCRRARHRSCSRGRRRTHSPRRSHQGAVLLRMASSASEPVKAEGRDSDLDDLVCASTAFMPPKLARAAKAITAAALAPLRTCCHCPDLGLPK